MNFIGLDISLTGTGYAIIHRSPSIYQTFLIQSKPHKTTVHPIERCDIICNELLSKYRPAPDDWVMVENFAYSKQFKMSAIAELTGIIKWRLLYECNIDPSRLLIASPQMLKKYCTGAAKAEKNVIIKSVFKKWGVDVNDDNEADAYCAARLAHGIYEWSFGKAPLSYELEVIKATLKLNPLYKPSN